MKSILHRDFKYVPAAKTDIAATFRRVKREQEQAAAERKAKVTPMKKVSA